MEALRFPWGGDDDARRREVAPSTFRPRKRTGGAMRSQASRPAPKPASARSRQPSVSRATTAVTAQARGSVRAVAHASREVARDRVAGRVVQGPQRDRHEPDYLLLLAAVALTAIGTLMVYASQGVDSGLREGGEVLDGVTTQLGWAIVGGLVLIFAMRLDYRYWRTFSVLGFVVVTGLLMLVLTDVFEPIIRPVVIGGAARWLEIGGLPPFHPAEMAKLAVVVYLAHWLAARGTAVSSFRRGMLPFLVIAGLVIGLVAVEPDLGTTGVITLTTFTMFFVAGGSLWQLLLLVPFGLAAVALLLRSYQMERWNTFLDPWAVAGDAGYQTVQGIYSLALGGITGAGLGQSSRPGGLDVPNAHNDYIFAIVGQELGMFGGIAVIGLFLLLAWRGLRIAMHAPDTFGGLLAVGITAWLAFQAFINIGVVVHLLPLTGLPLPFLSDGGTSLVVSLLAVGILLSISRETVSRGSPTHEDPGSSRGHRRPHLPGSGRRVRAASSES